MPRRSESQPEPDAKPRDGWSILYTRDVADYAASTLGVHAAFVLSRHLCEMGTRDHDVSLRTLAEATGMSRRGVSVATSKLLDAEMLARDKGERERSTYRPGARLLAIVAGETGAPDEPAPDDLAHRVSHAGAPGEPDSDNLAHDVSQPL